MADYSLHALPDNKFDAFGDYDKMRFNYVDALSFPLGSHDDNGLRDSSLHDAAQGAFKMPPRLQIMLYESGIQYVTILNLPHCFFDIDNNSMTTKEEEEKEEEEEEVGRRVPPPPSPLDSIFASAIGRCSLIRIAFCVVAEGWDHGGWPKMALRNGHFDELMTEDAPPTWSIRLQWFGISNNANANNNDGDDASGIYNQENQRE
jgi:hypothetical protein